MTEVPGRTQLPAAAAPPVIDPKDHTVGYIDPLRQRIWDAVSRWPIRDLWDFQGVPAKIVWQRTWKAFLDDNLLARAAELGFFFLFALFPTLVFASSLFGLAARQASLLYGHLLNYLAIVIPPSAFHVVVDTFNQTTQAASRGKLALGLVAALWSASVGFAAIQDTLNLVYKAKETRPYWKSRGSAMLVTLLLSVIVTVILASLLGGDFLARLGSHWLAYRHAAGWTVWGVAAVARTISWLITAGLLMLLFSTIYYFAPDVKTKCWQWLTPGAAIGIFFWLLTSLGLRLYLHFFNNYSVTYGSLGAVIILLTWFYITGLTLLAGAEINSEIQAAVAERKLKEAGVLPPQATTDKEHPVPVGAGSPGG
jgi:membrane protein